MPNDPTITATYTDVAGSDVIAHAAMLAAQRYHKLDELARGGSGRIIAARDLVLARAVAIKEPLEPQRDGPRLRDEAEILAGLQHPSIVPVYDTGVWNDGVPFFAMKLVEGRSLRDALRDAPSLEQRLAYVPQLIAVADAIAYAHTRNVIHRDLKPGNVLVGRFGETIVIDWGLAKRLDATPGAAAPPGDVSTVRGAVETSPGAVVGTPAYMAPEQARGAAVDRRADVYALGAILYHLLTGVAPFRRTTTTELLDAGGRDAPAPIDSLQPRAPADLVAIAHKAMASDPAARYQNAAELAEDLRRFETGRLVTARRYSLVARLRRWVRPRRRMMLGIVLAAGGATAVSLLVIDEPRFDASAACTRSGDGIRALWDPDHRFPDRSIAVRAAFRATAPTSADDGFARVAAPLDLYAAGWRAARIDACRATRLRGEQSDTMLDLRMQCLDQRRDDLDALLRAIAEPRREVLDRAVSAVTRLPPLTACDDARALQEVAPLPATPVVRSAVEAVRRSLSTAKALLATGGYREGLVHATEVVRAAESLGYQPLIAESLHVRSQLEARSGDARTAESTARASLLAAGDGHADAIAALAWANLLHILGNDLQRPGDALALQTAAEAALRRAGGDVDTAAAVWGAIGTALQNNGAPDQARGYHERVLAIREQAFGRDHLKVATTRVNLADTLNLLDRPMEALAHLQRALAIYERTLGTDHPDVATIVNNLGNAYVGAGDYAHALESYERAVDITAQALGPEHPALGSRLSNLGMVLDGMGRYDESARHVRRAIALLERAYGPDHRGVATGRAKLGATYMNQGKHEDARRELEHSVASYERTLGPTHIDLAHPLFILGELALRRHDKPAARKLMTRASEIVKATLGPAHPYGAAIDAGLATVAMAEGRNAEARTLAERAVRILESRSADQGLADARFVLARVLWTSPADRPRALALARAARDIYRDTGADKARPAIEIAAWLAGHDAR